MTIDEELTLLENNVRQLKIEYDIYFNGGAKKPPADLEWRVQSLVKKYVDGGKMNFSQRFRYNSISQKFALYNSLWQQKLKIKEEGYRRPQDAALGIAGMRAAEKEAAEAAFAGKTVEEEKAFRTAVSDPTADHENVQRLYNAMMSAKAKAGEKGGPANFESFKTFVEKKTEQLRKDYGCHAVEYSVEMENGQVKLKAKAKV